MMEIKIELDSSTSQWYYLTFIEKVVLYKKEWGSEGQISWDQNSTFSGDLIFDHEVEIILFQGIKTYNNIDQEVYTSIMRSKLPNNAFRVLISWKFCYSQVQSWDQN